VNPAPPSRKPNLIWLFGDQHRAQALGYNGDPNVRTPNIDRLAHYGVVFRNAVAGCPLCCPFRGSLLTGRYPHHAVPGHQDQLDPGIPTVAHAFKEEGYHTGYFGKWHVDGFKESEGRAAYHVVPPGRRGGFDAWLGYENNNSPWDCWVHGDTPAGEGSERLPGFETDALTDRFIAHLHERARGEEPFFAVLSVQPPHDPYAAPAEWMGRHSPAQLQLRPNVSQVPRVVERARRELAGYYAMIENWDWNIGRILAALETSGQAENTYVVFFSDHGDMHGSQGLFRKTNPYEESLRVPFIVSRVRNVYDTRIGSVPPPINHVDIAPTSLGLCGLPVPTAMEGADLSGFVRSGPLPANGPDSAFLQLVRPTGHPNSTSQPWRGVVTADGWKFASLENQPWLLFNLNEDPYEQCNLALNSFYKAERAKLTERLRDWIARTGDSFPLRN